MFHGILGDVKSVSSKSGHTHTHTKEQKQNEGQFHDVYSKAWTKEPITAISFQESHAKHAIKESFGDKFTSNTNHVAFMFW